MKHETTIDEFNIIAGALTNSSRGRKISVCRIALMHLLNDASQHLMCLDKLSNNLSDNHFYEMFEALDKRSSTKPDVIFSKIGLRNLLKDHAINSKVFYDYERYAFP